MKKFILYNLLLGCVLYQTSWASEINALENRNIPQLHRSVTFLGLGGIELGRNWGIDEKGRGYPVEKEAKKILQTAIIRKKISVIDTASSYQLSEARISRYVSPKKYHYLLITKAGEYSIKANDAKCKKPDFISGYCEQPKSDYDFSPAAIRRDVEQSLNQFHVKQLDVVLLHLNNKNADEIIRKGEATQTLKELQREGKIRFIGVSINGAIAKKCIESNQFQVIELEYNLLNQNNAENINLAHERGMAVIVRGGLGTGLLTSQVMQHLDDSILPYGEQVRSLLALVDGNVDALTQLALAFLYKNKNISSVIVGVNKPEQLIQNIHLLNTFNNEKLLDQAQALVKKFKTPDKYTEVMGEFYE